MSDLYVLIGRRLREERKTRGLSIEKLAELAEITPSFLGLIERGERKLSVLTLDKLSRALQIPATALMTEEPAKPAAWESSILHLLRAQPASAQKLVFKTLDCLVKNLPSPK